MLAERWNSAAQSLQPIADYQPYPRAEDRPHWEGLHTEQKQGILDQAQRMLEEPWVVLPAERYMDYRRDGNRSRFQALYGSRRSKLAALVLAECVEGQGRYCDEIINGLWLICEESSWVIPAHNRGSRYDADAYLLADVKEPIIDLFAAETGAFLAWIYYLLGRKLADITPLVPERIALEVEQRILQPYLERDDFWWMGFQPTPKGYVNNWNPWINSNCLAAFLLLDSDDKRRAAGAAKTMASTDIFLAGYHSDGGCDEGPGYWGHAGGSLFDLLEQAYAVTGGAFTVFDEPLIKNIGRYIYRVHIAGEYFVNFADSSPRVRHDPALVYAYGRAVGDRRLASLGAGVFAPQQGRPVPGGYALLRTLRTLFTWDEVQSFRDHVSTLVRETYLEGIQVVTAREVEGSADGLFFSAKGGHNGESHNHNDVGNFILYVDGQPVIVDAGVENYTAKTFSPQRYEIWTMQSAYHNLPTINGVQQAPGRSFAAKDVHCAQSEQEVHFALDLADAYPQEAQVEFWRRQFWLQRGKTASARLVIEEHFRLRQAEAATSLHLICADEIELTMPGQARLRVPGEAGKTVILSYPDELVPEVECIPIRDSKLENVWGTSLWRLVLKTQAPCREAKWNIILTVGSG